MFLIGESTRWAAGFVTFALSITACLDDSEPTSSSTHTTSNDAGEFTDVAAGGDGGSSADDGSSADGASSGLCVPRPIPPIDPEPHVDCKGRPCGQPCDPCKDPRTCVDATAQAFLCNWARQCVETDLCTPRPIPPIDPEPHVDCKDKACGQPCDPCKDSRTCVDATAQAFVCNWARRCVQFGE